MTRIVEHEEHGPRGTFFVVEDGERIGEMTYSRAGASLAMIDHTFVLPRLRGQNVARSLLDAAVAWARQNQLRLGATCSYVVAQFARDPSLQDVQDVQDVQG